MTRNRNNPRKHVLYIESAAAVRLYPRWHERMLVGLNSLYRLSWGLDDSSYEAVEESNRRGPVDGIVANARGLACGALDEFRMAETVPIVAFTGAQARDLIPIYGEADIVLLKKANVPEDIRQIEEALSRLWKRRKPKPPPPPDIRIEAGHTVTQAAVRLVSGITVMGAAQITREWGKHQRPTTFELMDGSKVVKTCPGVGVMSLMSLQLEDGSVVRITVEGTDALADKWLRRLYGAFTSRYDCLLRMDRFEAPERT